MNCGAGPFGSATSSRTAVGEALFHADVEALMARSELRVPGAIHCAQQGIPVANGRFGGPVWQGDARTLWIQLNHTDAFMFNDASAASDDRGGALGRVSLDVGEAAFDEATEQRLDLFRGRLELRAGEIRLAIFADMAGERVRVEIDDGRERPLPMTLRLEMLRQPELEKGAHTALSALSASEGCAVLSQAFSEPCDTGLSENDFYCATAVAVRVPGVEGAWRADGERALVMTLPMKRGARTIDIGGWAGMDPDVDAQAAAVAAVRDSEDPGPRSRAWWRNFWEQSWVYLPDRPRFELRRNYALYLLAICNRGRFPGKYNGGIWIGDGDRRDWGAWYWNWNQDSLYQPLLEANHAELLEPMFAMRWACYDRYRDAARQLWGAEGLFIPETCGVLGYERLPEDIARGLREYLTGDGPLDEAVRQLGERRNAFLTPWNWRLSEDRVSYVTHTLVATMETAEYFWMRYLYGGNVEWFRRYGWPFLRGAAEFYRTFPGFVREADGRYHFHRTNLHEHIWGGRDVIDDLALARGVFAAAARASELLDVDADLRARWRECLEGLADYPRSTDEGALGGAAACAEGGAVWAQGREPAFSVRGLDGIESPQFKMLERFDVLNLETRDQGLDGGDWTVALNTYFKTPGYRKQYQNREVDENGSSRFLTDAAKLGRAGELPGLLETQARQFADTPNLLHDEGDYYSAEGYGTWTAALQLALCQSLAPRPGMDPVIRVFPAWTGIDARFKLAAKGGFLVTSAMAKGRVEYIGIESQLGGVCRVRNPWNGADGTLNGRQLERFEETLNDLIEVRMQPGDRLVLVRPGDDPAQHVAWEVAPSTPFETDRPDETVRGFWDQRA